MAEKAGVTRPSSNTSSSSIPIPSSATPSTPPPPPPTINALANKDYTHYVRAPLYTGLFGTGLGTAVGAFRGHSPLLYALHMGIGYGVFGATFSSTLYGLEKVRGEEGTLNWIGAGAAAGAVTSLITAGPKQVGRGAVFFGCMGFAAEAICDAVGDNLNEYREKRASERTQGR